jgi:hypothetical protein
MPLAKDPNRPEFYVYLLAADDVPFYVGIGRSARASDRVRYVRYLVSREARGKPVKWGLSNRVVAELLVAGCEVKVEYCETGLPRANALIRERSEIDRLLGAGFVLANIQHNPQRHKVHRPVVEAVLVKCGKLAPNEQLQPTPERTSRVPRAASARRG